MRAKFGAATVSIERGDISLIEADAVVNAANTELAMGTGVAGAIKKRGGVVIEEEAMSLGPVEVGEAVLTTAGNLRATHIIHAAVMDYRDGFRATSFPSLDVITACCLNIVRAVDALPEPVTLAWVALGAGTGQLGVREPTRIACETLLAHPSTNLQGVTFYGYDLVEYAAIADVVSRSFPEVLATVPAEIRKLFEAR